MKILKYILVVVAILIAIPLLAGLFINKEYHVEREITIKRPKETVFTYVKHLKNQVHYNKWTMMDPSQKTGFKGEDGTVGFSCWWDSEKKDVGKGEQQILKIKEGERIDLGLHFIRPFEGDATAHMVTESIAIDDTKLKWGMKGRTPYPMNVMNLFIDWMLGKDMETSLTNLKVVLEKDNQHK